MKFRKFAVYLGLSLVLLACSGDYSRPLKVATNLWVGYEPLYLAQYLGAYEQEVDVIQLASATEVMRAMAHGNVDVAALTLDEAITLMSKGLDLVVLMALDYSRGGDAIIASAGTSGELKGLRVGVENTALGAIVLSEALDQAGLQFSDVSIVNLSPDEHEAALEQGRVDAVVTFEPVKSRLLAKGGRVLFDTRQAPELVVDVLVARRGVLTTHVDQINLLISGYVKAREYMTTHHSEAEVFFCKRLQLDKTQLQQAFDGVYLPTLRENVEWFSGQPSRFNHTFNQVLRVMKERNLIQGEPVLREPPSWVLEVSS